jgi:hypothetical protein
MNQAVIAECVSKTQELLQEHWDEIQSIREGEPNEKIKIGIDFNINYRGDEQIIRTKIAFGVRKTDARESVINPNQLEIPFEGNGAEPTDQEVESIKTTKKRGRRPVAATAEGQ